jgi:16S rRNA G966 N2-methylase RsmD
MVKQAVFNIIQPHLGGARVLDLFSGTGQLGIEALSRGAERCVFVDSSPASLELTRKNVSAARFDARAELVRADALSYLSRAAGFDVIFIDPPYDGRLAESGPPPRDNAFLGPPSRGSAFPNPSSRGSAFPGAAAHSSRTSAASDKSPDGYLLDAALKKINEFDILRERGIIVCESRAGHNTPDAEPPYKRLREYRYGGVKITLYSKETTV